MNKAIKLLILIILSLSVYFIYQNTKETKIKIITFGDSLSLGINSYGNREYGYIDYLKDYLEETKEVELMNYSDKTLSIQELLEKIKTNPKIKGDLLESHLLILNVGYNDIIYKINLEENISPSRINKINDEITKSYDSLLKEINKYYKNKIIVVGYPKSNSDNYYYNVSIRNLNKYLENNKRITYIDTYKLLSNRIKYFSNPNSYYPNRNGYLKISRELINIDL